jgi:homoserine O-acetyltransferase
MNPRLIYATISLIAFITLPVMGQNSPVPAQGDFTIRNFKFDSGDVLPELKLHYRTLGTPRRDGSGIVRNAVLVMHGTGGSGGGFMSDQFAGALFRPGQLLDAAKFFIIFPDGIGHGQSSGRVTDYARGFRIMATTIWSRHTIDC